MKKLVSLLLVFVALLSLSSCKIGEDKEGQREEVPEAAKEIVSQYEEMNTRKDPQVIENLSDEQKEYFDSISEIGESKKFVAYTDNVNYTLVYSCEFENNVVSKVMSYHIVKNDAYFNAISAGIDSRSPATVDKENKVIKADKTKEYASKTYEEMEKEFSQYAFVE